MARIIKDRQITDDGWLVLESGLTPEVLGTHSGSDVIVPLQTWLEHKPLLANHDGRIGVWLDSHELPEQIADDLPSLPVVALNFPEFKDGRAFSSARELRQRYGYEGEIRAIGDVARDQLFYMARCGFDAFDMRADQDLEKSLEAFNDFQDAYQPAMDQPLPLFRRR